LGGAAEGLGGGFGEAGVDVAVAAADGVELARFGEAVATVDGDGGQRPVAAVGAGRGRDEGAVDEGGEGVGGGGRGEEVLAQGGDGVEAGTAGDGGQAGEDVAFGGPEKVPAPVDDGAQRALPFGHAAGFGDEEPVGQFRGEVGGAEGGDAGGGEFEREREAVEADADRGDVGGVGVGEGEGGVGGAGADGEEADGGRLGDGLARLGQAEGPEGLDVLAGKAERFAAGGEDADTGGGEEAAAQFGRGLDEVLAVVEDDQDGGAVEGGTQERLGGGGGAGGGGAGAAAQAHGLGDGGGQEVGPGVLAVAAEVDEPGSAVRSGGGEGEAGLADAAGP